MDKKSGATFEYKRIKKRIFWLKKKMEKNMFFDVKILRIERKKDEEKNKRNKLNNVVTALSISFFFNFYTFAAMLLSFTFFVTFFTLFTVLYGLVFFYFFFVVFLTLFFCKWLFLSLILLFTLLEHLPYNISLVLHIFKFWLIIIDLQVRTNCKFIVKESICYSKLFLL